MGGILQQVTSLKGGMLVKMGQASEEGQFDLVILDGEWKASLPLHTPAANKLPRYLL